MRERYCSRRGYAAIAATVVALCCCWSTSTAAEREGGMESATVWSFLNGTIEVEEGLDTRSLAAVEMFRNQVAKRTLQVLPVVAVPPSAWASNSTAPTIRFSMSQVPSWCSPDAVEVPVHPEAFEPSWMLEQRQREGYCIFTDPSSPIVTVAAMAATSQGVLFGAGMLLQQLDMSNNAGYDVDTPSVVLQLSHSLNITTYPEYWLRGQMISYRSISNTYDAWSIAQMEAYIADLAVFGTNQVEFVAPDGNDDPHFQLTPLDMDVALSGILDKYGLNVSVWYPQDSPSWDLIPRLVRMDALFVPSGDPGSTAPRPFLEYVEEQAAFARGYHPDCQVWISCQDFNSTWVRGLIGEVNANGTVAEWLTGMVYGPSTRITLQELRRVLDPKFPLRHYPDICHNLKCEFPVPDWDFGLAFTEAREVVNPLPLHQERIVHIYQPYTIGFGAYSDGSKDDVNAIVWSALGWDSRQNVTDVLETYGRYFISNDLGAAFKEGLLMMEGNWQGSLYTNDQVLQTFDHFTAIAANATAKDWRNWRFLMSLYRVHYDRFQQERLLYEAALQSIAYDILRSASVEGANRAIEDALAVLHEPFTLTPAGNAMHGSVTTFGAMLLESIGMQLSVYPPFFSSNLGRGDNLDTIMVPLNDERWLNEVLVAIKQNLTVEEDKLTAIDAVLSRTDPGPGGFYDDLGDVLAEQHLVPGQGFETDPLFHNSSFRGYQEPFNVLTVAKVPNSYLRYAQTIYNQPLQLHYPDLNSTASYTAQVVYYNGDKSYNDIRLQAVVQPGTGAEQRFLMHDYIAKPYPMRPLQFPVPEEALVAGGGDLYLQWNQPFGEGADGESCEVAEVLLMETAFAATKGRQNRILDSLLRQQ